MECNYPPVLRICNQFHNNISIIIKKRLSSVDRPVIPFDVRFSERSITAVMHYCKIKVMYMHGVQLRPRDLSVIRTAKRAGSAHFLIFNECDINELKGAWVVIINHFGISSELMCFVRSNNMYYA